MPQLETLLAGHFGFEHFQPGQKAIIQAILAGQDTLGILPTGSGKSLCYQLPTLVKAKPTLIIEPLIALMHDQVGRLQAAGEKRVLALSGQIAPNVFPEVLRNLGQYRYLFISPEMLQRKDVLAALKQLDLGLFVVDEAHCISQWGPDFRPAYLQLGQVRSQLHVDAVLALTATAPERVRADILTQLNMQHPVTIAGSVDRPNIFLGVDVCPNEEAKRQKLQHIMAANIGPTIVYCPTRAASENLAGELQKTGTAAAFYHAGLDQHQRDLIQRQFQSDQLQVICATSAFGMGIDKANVRLVVHLFVPESLEAYYQAIGRAGRDGAPSLAAMVVTQDDLKRSQALAGMLPDQTMIQTIFAHPEIYRNFDDPQVSLIEAYITAGFSLLQTQQQLEKRMTEKQNSFTAMSAFVNASGCRRALLLKHFDSPVPAHGSFCCGPVTPDVLQTFATEKGHQTTPPKHWQAVFRQIFR